MPTKSYILNQDYLATSKVAGSNESRQFKAKETVVGEAYQPAQNSSVRYMPMILVDGKFLLPLQIVTEAPEIKLTSGAGLVSTADALKKSANFKKGAVIGAVAGATYAVLRNKNVFWTTLIAMTVGGFIGYAINQKK